MSEIESNQNGIVLSLFEQSGNMVRPWARAGYECIAVDNQNDGTEEEHVGDGIIYHVEADIREYIPPRTQYRIVFAFPPCTNLAVSGARWFEQKGIDGLAAGLELVERAKRICEWSDAPWMLENPVSTISSYWREPDHTFHPYEFDPYTDQDEAYRKKTCLWTGGNFRMPEPHEDASNDGDDRIHKMPPSEDRSDTRAETPAGFANAVFKVNESEHLPDWRRRDTSERGNGNSIIVPNSARKRDEVWIAVIRELQSNAILERTDIADEVSASNDTIKDVLASMRDASLLNHTKGSRYWERSAAFSQIIGHPTPKSTTHND